jgi:hypothetical protein
MMGEACCVSVVDPEIEQVGDPDTRGVEVEEEEEGRIGREFFTVLETN